MYKMSKDDVGDMRGAGKARILSELYTQSKKRAVGGLPHNEDDPAEKKVRKANDIRWFETNRGLDRTANQQKKAKTGKGVGTCCGARQDRPCTSGPVGPSVGGVTGPSRGRCRRVELPSVRDRDSRGEVAPRLANNPWPIFSRYGGCVRVCGRLDQDRVSGHGPLARSLNPGGPSL